ncbi:MAG: hypothetical protein AAB804_00480 [Patescibacteria group bacterium]
MDLNPIQGQQQEIARLVRENNKMLHAMRRHALWGGLFKLLVYGFFLLAPIWFYMTYLNGTMQQMLKAVDQVQATGTKAQVQLGSFQKTWEEFRSKLPAFMQASTSTTQ